MHTRQSPYEIIGDCSDKGGHRYQPLYRFILREVLARREGTGTRPDYLVNRADKKTEGTREKSAQKSRNSRKVSGGCVGTEGMVTKGANWRGPGTNTNAQRMILLSQFLCSAWDVRESLCWIRMTRTARQDARRSGKEDAGHSLLWKMPLQILRGTQ